MDNNFRLAVLDNEAELLKEISRYEKELSKRIGQDIVLIAYMPDKSR